jgi:DNA polymerase III subunit epsilon
MKKDKKIIEVPFEDADYCVFDFETTGMSARSDKVIDIGIVKIQKGKITDTFSSFINPGRHIPYFITSLTGITNSDVEDAPYFEDVFNSIKSFIGNSILVAHNLSFDYNFLKNECTSANLNMPSNEAICTLKLAKKLYPQLPSKSLGNLIKTFKIKHRNVHRGLGDATATAKLFIKMHGTLREDHDIETISDLVRFQSLPSATTYKIMKKKLADDYLGVPSDPGIYFFKNAKDEVIYIGKAKSLKQRVSNYFTNSTPRKTKKIVQRASRLGFQVTNTELTALLSEAELIKEKDPNFNTLLKSYSRSYFIRITTTDKFPRIEVTTKFDFDGNEYFGPYPNRLTATSIKEIIDKTFLMRECTDKVLKKRKKCYLADIERCYAPCATDVYIQYKNELSKVFEFLSGHNQSAVDRLLLKMKEYSEKQKYEEAANTRDIINSIFKQLNKASILSEPINKANALIEIQGAKENDYMLLLEGKPFIKNFFPDKKDLFDDALSSYFDGTIKLFRELSEKDLERLKISLSWLVKNKTRIKIHYLKDYTSIEKLAANFLFIKPKGISYEEID